MRISMYDNVVKPVSVSIEDATQYCGIGRTKLYELIREGKFSARKLGTKTLILTEELDAYIYSLPVSQPLDRGEDGRFPKAL